MAIVAGYGGRVLVNDKIMRANKWSVDFTLETDDMTSTQGAQYQYDEQLADQNRKINTKRIIPKVCEISVNIDAFYDTDTNGKDPAVQRQYWLSSISGFKMTPGNTVKLKLYPGKHLIEMQTSYWYFPEFLITQCTQNAEVRGIVKLTFSGKNNSPKYEIFEI